MQTQGLKTHSAQCDRWAATAHEGLLGSRPTPEVMGSRVDGLLDYALQSPSREHASGLACIVLQPVQRGGRGAEDGPHTHAHPFGLPLGQLVHLLYRQWSDLLSWPSQGLQQPRRIRARRTLVTPRLQDTALMCSWLPTNTSREESVARAQDWARMGHSRLSVAVYLHRPCC